MCRLHYNATTAAATSTVVGGVRVVERAWRTRGTALLTGTAGLLFLGKILVIVIGLQHLGIEDAHLVVLPDLTDEVSERLIDVDTLLSRGLNKLAAKVLCQVTTL